MKKTLLITMDFYPSIGGISRYYERLSDCMPASDWAVLAPTLPVGVFEEAHPYAIYRKRFFSKFLWPRWLMLAYAIYRIVKKEQIRCMLVGQVLPVGSAVWLVSFFTGIPYVVSLHGMDLGCAQKSYRKYTAASCVLKYARKIVVNSSDTAHKAMQFGVGEQRIAYIYPCADIPHTAFIERTGEHYPVLLTISRLVQRKGIQYSIEAMPRVLQVFPTCRYIIAGGGQMMRELNGLIQAKGLRDHVECIGIISDEAKDALYRECDMFVMAPYEDNGDVEGFGMVYLEANSFGKPVIGTRSGGVPDAVVDGKTGILVEEKNSDTLAEAILRLAKDTTFAQRLGAQGCERVKQEFQWSVQAKKLEKILTYL